MKCINCKGSNLSVADTRIADDFIIKRRRECLDCNFRFNTFEKPVINEIIVIKRDGSKSIYDRSKIKRGIIRAFNNIPIENRKIDQIVDDIEESIKSKYKSNVKSSKIGDLVLEKLSLINDVAYIRFASVYHKFSDADSFIKLIEKLKTSKV